MNNEQIIIDKDKFGKAENEPINQESVNKFIEETDKFYVNGVDVSGCTQYDPDEVLNCNDYCLCKELPDCYYKLWKRKEQECEKANKNAQDTYDLFQAQMESFNILQGEKIKLETQLDQFKAENETLFKAIEEVNKINKKLESENEELKKQLESTKGLVTVGNRQLAEALLELQKYKDNEQQEKEIQKLYNKLEGSSLIDYKNKRGRK